MITISLCMILRDEEKTIGKCLSGAKKFVDEIIIVDTGSIDNTKEMVKSFGVKLYEYKWSDNFSEARNYAFSKATKDYILWLDGDDFIDEENIKKLNKLKNELNINYDAVAMEYSLARNEKGETTHKLRRNRLVKRNKNYKWIGQVHEYLDVNGNVLDSDIVINHDKKKSSGARNLNIFKKMDESKEEFTARDLFYYGNELYDNGFYEQAYEKYVQFLESGKGWEGDIKRATIKMAYSLENKEFYKKRELAFNVLKDFKPNGEILCLIADSFFDENKYNEAIFWYKSAIEIEQEESYLEEENKSDVKLKSALNICLCYEYLGDYKKAYYYNELSNDYGAEKEKIEHNKKYIHAKLIEKGITIEEFKK